MSFLTEKSKSILMIILGIIALVAFMSYRNTIIDSTMFMDRLEGKKENKPKEISEPENFDVNVEGIYRIAINSKNTITKESENITDEAHIYAFKINNKNSDEGYIGNYIYKVRRFGNNSKEITLIESESTINRLKTTIILLVLVGFLGVGIINIIASKISKIIVKPVEESFEKQKQFVSDASHELKTPLAVIEANADVLESKVGNNKWISYIQSEVQSMNKLVNDLLVLARMENISDLNKQKFDLSKEVELAVSVFESLIYERKIKLETNISEGIEFNGSPDDIKHIISIILDNAIKHTEENNRIIVYLSKEKNNIKIEIKNQGEPIPEEERKKIFERFYRIDKARNRFEKRYGLRSSYCKRNCK